VGVIPKASLAPRSGPRGHGIEPNRNHQGLLAAFGGVYGRATLLLALLRRPLE